MPEPAPVTTAMWFWRRGMVGFPLLLVLSFRYKLIQNLSGENEKLYLCIVVVSLALPMDKHLSKWKHSVERIWSAAAPDYGEAACHAAGFWNCPRRAMRWCRRGERTRPGLTGMSTISVVSAIYFGDEPRWCGSWSGS